MTDKTCFICNETLSSDTIVTVICGLETTRNVSVERGDVHIKWDVPLEIYKNPGICQLNKTKMQNVNYEETSGVSTFNIIDLLWMFRKSKDISHLPGWNGFIKCLTKKKYTFQCLEFYFYHSYITLQVILTEFTQL